MKTYTKPEIANTDNARIVTVLAAKAVGMLLGAYVAKKLLGDDIVGKLQGIEGVLACE